MLEDSEEEEIDPYEYYCQHLADSVLIGDVTCAMSTTLSIVEYAAGLFMPEDRATFKALIDKSFKILGNEIYEDDQDFIDKICEET